MRLNHLYCCEVHLFQ